MDRRRKHYIVPLLGLCVALSLSLTPTKASAPSLPETVRTLETGQPDAPPVVEVIPEPEAAAGSGKTPDPEPAGAVIPPQTDPVDDTYFEDTVFLGDSRTEGLSLYGGPETAVYLFSVGATVESVFTKDVEREDGTKAPLLDTLAELDCGKVYVMLGVNELGWPKSEQYRTQTGKLIDRIREDHPDAVVVLQSLLPVSALQDSKGSYVNNDRIAVYNQILRELADEKACVWLDVGAALTDETGCLPADLNNDGVHLNVQGCGIWTDYLRTHPVT